MSSSTSQGSSRSCSSASTSQKGLLKANSHIKRNDAKQEGPFKHISTVWEGHNKTIYGCAFNPYSKRLPYFATVGENRVTIYGIVNGGKSVKLLRNYKDPEKEEAFFAVCWAYDTDENVHVVVVGGARGIIRVLDAKSGSVVSSLTGHGAAVNDLRVCPRDSTIVASASKDFTARIWNIRNCACLVVLGGVKGHLDQVISVDFDYSSEYLATASMDHTIKLWYVGEGSGVDRMIEQSKSVAKIIDVPLEIHYPYGSTRDIHTNYVDCVRIFRKMIFSKSTENEIVLWKFGDFTEGFEGKGSKTRIESAVLHVRQMEIPDTNMWFIKFEIDPLEKYLVCGNQKGEIHIWDLDSGALPSKRSDHVTSVKEVQSTIRQLAFSQCGLHLIAVGDDASVSHFVRRNASSL